MEALALLQEWVRDVGSQAGFTAQNTRIFSGAIGSPESRLELEVTVESMADLEQLWGAIPADLHAAWSQRARNLLIDGSPRWDVLRTCAVLPEASGAAVAAVAPAVAAPAASYSRPSPSGRPLRVPRGVNPWKAEDTQQAELASTPVETLGSGLVVPAPEEHEPDVILDWKGDPMIINPGDKLPFF